MAANSPADNSAKQFRSLDGLPPPQLELEKVRAEGVAVDNEENHEGIICVGGPIFASQGKVIAALSISGLTIHMAQKLEACKAAARETVQKISALLGYAGASDPGSRDGAQPSPAETPSSKLASR